MAFPNTSAGTIIAKKTRKVESRAAAFSIRIRLRTQV